MKGFVLAAGLLAVGLAGVAPADEKALKELEGAYKVASIEKNGKSATKDQLDDLTVAVKGDDFTLVTKDGEKKAKIKVDATKTPHAIDITPTDGPEKGKTFPGIYKTEKGEVTIAFNEKGDRPTGFKADGDVMLLTMKKAEKEKDKK